MNLQNQPSKHSLNYKLKPVSLFVLSLFAQQAIAQSELAQDNASLALSKQLADSSAIESKLLVQTNHKKLANIVVADASTAIKAKSNTKYKTNPTAESSIDVYDVLLGDDPSTNAAINNIPSTADRYGVTKEILKTAAVTDAQAQGTGKVDSQGKPIGNKSVDIDLKAVTVRAKRFHEIGPLPGLGLTKEEIPGNVQSISAKEIKESHALSIADLMNTHLQSVNVNDYQSNPFQMDVQYRGFTASPQVGTAQGISVFLDGIRVNEPFGDVVNWDMLPMNALKSLDMFPGSNPIFGLGTLGGALAMRTKSGFDGKSLDGEVLAGSFGRKQLQVSAGDTNGVIAGFASGNFFLEDGWRDDSPSKVNQVFGKAEWRNEKVQLGISMLYAGNKLTGNGLLPTQMVDQNPKQVYTSPDESKNDLLQFQLSGIWDVSDTFNVTGQIYKRNSKRKSRTSDVNENFGGTDGRGGNVVTDKDGTKQLLPGLQDINRDGRPDYNNYAMNVAADAAGNPLTNSGAICTDPNDPCVNDLAIGTQFANQNGLTALAAAAQGTVTAQDGSGNTVLNWAYDPRLANEDTTVASSLSNVFNEPTGSASYDQLVRLVFNNRGVIIATQNSVNFQGVPLSSTSIHPLGGATYSYPITFSQGQAEVLGNYTDDAGFNHLYYELPVINGANVGQLGGGGGVIGQGLTSPVQRDANGNIIYRDGKFGELNGVGTTGFADGTPTALFTDTQIDQVGTGGALQLNWNLDQHKLMVGASVDMSDSTYASKQYLGVLDDKRHGHVDDSFLGWEYAARDAASGFALNDFSGDSITKSIYASETWTPVKTLNITAAARFNHTVVNNALSTTNLSRIGDVNDILNVLNLPALCTDNNNDGTIDPNTECPLGLNGNIVPFDPSYAFSINSLIGGAGQNFASFRAPQKESFTYRSFNPALGATWQATDTLNLYGNWSKGARTPTVIELGCAFDSTPAEDGRPRSIAEQRSCNLPTAMGGDPYLKQVRSTSYELGARGRLTDDIEWNASVYRTDLKDDIYFVSVNAVSSFFENIGDTRRQGFEMGLKGKSGKSHFGLNYALTDATFQNTFNLASPHNSSADNVDRNENVNFGTIKVQPGNRLPGIPLHNLNANFSYEITDKWIVGMSAVMHSNAFVRGNENNKHEAGSAKPILTTCRDVNGNTVNCEVTRADFGSGKTAGYTVFNFQTSYRLTPAWMLGLQVNNVFNKQYASAGRLGLNAFSPSIKGAVGSNGFNYNSSDWQGTSFLGTGAPRAAWVTLSYEFQPDKK